MGAEANIAIGYAIGALAKQSAAFSAKTDRVFECIAHRGFANEAPENTMFAYRHALKRFQGNGGVLSLETDVQPASDSATGLDFILMHDDTVDRTTTSSGNVNTFTLAQFDVMDAGSVAGGANFNKVYVPRLSALLALGKQMGCKLYLEIKGSWWTNALIDQFAAQVVASGIERRCNVNSFTLAQLQRFRQTSPLSEVMFEASTADTTNLAATAAMGTTGPAAILFASNLVGSGLDASLVATYRAAGVDVVAYTTGFETTADHGVLLDMGIYRIFSNTLLRREDCL